MNAHEPTEEELRAAVEEQMRRITVEDLLLQTVVTLVNLAGRRLGLAPSAGPDEKDLDQSRLAIEATRAILPVLPPEQVAPIKDALSQLQIAFAREAKEGGQPAEEGAPGARPSGGPTAPGRQQRVPADAPAADEAARAKARAKIWTPPGA